MEMPVRPLAKILGLEGGYRDGKKRLQVTAIGYNEGINALDYRGCDPAGEKLQLTPSRIVQITTMIPAPESWFSNGFSGLNPKPLGITPKDVDPATGLPRILENAKGVLLGMQKETNIRQIIFTLCIRLYPKHAEELQKHLIWRNEKLQGITQLGDMMVELIYLKTSAKR